MAITTLHALTLTATTGGAVSDTKALRFGIREVSYDLSLFDSKGALRRVNVQPTNGYLRGEKLIDVDACRDQADARMAGSNRSPPPARPRPPSPIIRRRAARAAPDDPRQRRADRRARRQLGHGRCDEARRAARAWRPISASSARRT